MTAAQAREWIEHAPTTESLNITGLVGWTFAQGGGDLQCRETNGGPWFLCADCAARLLARGCSWSTRDASPVWAGHGRFIEPCAVCNTITP